MNTNSEKKNWQTSGSEARLCNLQNRRVAGSRTGGEDPLPPAAATSRPGQVRTAAAVPARWRCPGVRARACRPAPPPARPPCPVRDGAAKHRALWRGRWRGRGRRRRLRVRVSRRAPRRVAPRLLCPGVTRHGCRASAPLLTRSAQRAACSSRKCASMASSRTARRRCAGR